MPSLQDCPSFILRMTSHVWSHHEETRSAIPEEFASLLSVLSGTRMAAGANYTRRWGFDEDPLGQPIFTHETLVVPKRSLLRSAVFPHITKRRGLDQDLLKSFPESFAGQVAGGYKSRPTISASSLVLGEPAGILLAHAGVGHRDCGCVLAEAPALSRRTTWRAASKFACTPLVSGGEKAVESGRCRTRGLHGCHSQICLLRIDFFAEQPPGNRSPEKSLRELTRLSKALHSGVAVPRDDGHVGDFEQVTRDALVSWWKSLASGSQGGNRAASGP